MRNRKILLAVATGWVLVLAAGVLVAWQAGGGSADAATGRAPVKLTWDLSAGRPLSAVGWPAGWNYEPWFIDGPGEVEIILPGGKRGTFPFTLVEVRQDTGRVRTIRVFGEAGPLQGAHAEATALMNDWGLGGHESLEKWFMKRRRDGMGYQDPAGPDWATPSDQAAPFPRYGVAIQTTHRSDIPWCVQWGVMFAKPGDTSAP